MFYETQGIVDIRVIAASNGTGTSGTSIAKYIGLQDGTKTIGATAPNCTTSAANYWNGVNDVISAPQAWRFTPPSNYATKWYATPAGGSTTLISNSFNVFSLPVAPTVTTHYAISYTNQTTGCANDTSLSTAHVDMSIRGNIGGTYNVGVGQAYTTLTDAVNDYNVKCMTAPVTFLLTDATYPSETFPIVVGINATANSTNKLTIKPASGVTTTISGSSPDAIIKLSSADYVVIDGSNNGTTSRDLTITNTNTVVLTAPIWVASSVTVAGPDGATNNTIKNCNLNGQTNTTTVAGIVVGSGAIMGNAADTSNSNLTIQNNLFTKTQNGIYFNGNATVPDPGLVITGNSFGSLTVNADRLGFRGAAIINTQAFSFTNNTIAGVISANGFNQGLLISGNIIGGDIVRNKIFSVQNSNTSATLGIYAIGLSATTTNSNVNVYNNTIYDVKAFGSSTVTNNAYGIYIGSGGGYNIRFNSINMGSSQDLAASYTAAIYVDAAVTAPASIEIRNNILVDSSNTTLGRYAIYSGAASSVFSIIDYNDYYVPGTLGTSVGLGYIGGASQTSLASFATAFGGNANSLNANPQFAQPTFLGPTTGSPVLHAGQQIAGITNDILLASRSNPPTMGAYENVYTLPTATFTLNTPVVCTGAPVAHTVTVAGTAGSAAIVSGYIDYTVNGGTTNVLSLTQTGNSFSATIPVNGTSVIAYQYYVTDANGVESVVGIGSYQDNPLTGVTAVANATPGILCAGNTTTLQVVYASTAAAPGYANPTAVTNPTSDEDVSNITISNGTSVILNNTSANNSLTGTIGTASGTVGSYSNFTAFGPYSLTAGVLYNFSVSSSTSGTAFSNALAIYIDYNRNGNFADPGERVYASSVTTSGAHTETGTFTIPSSALIGLTRMRIISNEGLISSSTPAVSYGEFEDYMLSITNPNFGTSISWSNGTTTVGTTNPLILTPSATKTYTATTDVNGCPLVSSDTMVTVNPLPTAPTSTTATTQCGLPTYTATTTLSGGTFNWYDVAVGGIKLDSNSTSGSYDYDNFVVGFNKLWVSVSNPITGCEGPRTQIGVQVNAPPAISLSLTGPVTLCANNIQGISVTGGGYTTYTWSLPISHLYTNSGATTSYIAGTPATTIFYKSTTAITGEIIKVKGTTGAGGCTNTQTVVFNVNPNPVIDSITALPLVTCPGGNVNLSVYSSALGAGPAGLPGTYCVPAQLGSALINSVTFNTLSNTGLNQASPYYDIYPASGSTTTTVTAGNTYPISLTTSTSSIVSVWIDYDRSGTFDANEWVQPWTVATSGTFNITIPITATAGETGMRIRSRSTGNTNGSTDGCTTSFGSGSSQDYTINIVGVTPQNSNFNYVWKTGTTTVGTAATITLNPTLTKTYIATITNPSTTPACFTVSSPVTVTVDNTPIVATVTGVNSLCPGSSTTLTASATPAGQIFTYSWLPITDLYTDAAMTVAYVGGPINQSVIYVKTPGATRTYTVTVTNVCGQTGTSSRTVTVNPVPTSIVTTTGGTTFCTPGPGSIVLNGSTNLTTPTPQYQWKLNGVNISGATSATYTIPGATTGSYSLLVTNSATSCNSTSSVVGIVSAARPTVSVTATPTTMCAGSTLTLTSTATPGTAGYTVSGTTYNFDPMSGATTLVSGGTNNSSSNFTGSLDDGGWNSIPIPFTFNFYGSPYSALSVATNGNLQFGAGSTTVSSYPTSTGGQNGLLPSTIMSNFIAGPWMDAVFSSTGTIKYLTTGVAPNRKFIVEWNGPVFSGTDNLISQVVLNEGTNYVEVHFQQFGNNALKNYSIGVQGTGTAATAAPSRNAVTFSTAADEGWIFKPTTITNYAWTGPSSYSSTLQNPTPITTVVGNSGQYSLLVTDNNGCTKSATTSTITVNPILTPSVTMAITAGSNPSCQGGAITFAANPVNGGTSPTYQWYVDGSPSPGAVNATFTVSGITTLYNPSVYVLMTVTPGTCVSSNTAQSAALDLTVQTNSWTGTYSTQWADPRNWCSNAVPTAAIDVTIPVLSSGRYPILSAAGNVHNINIVSGASVTMSNTNLTVAGVVSGTGHFAGFGNSGLIFTASGSVGTLYFEPTGITMLKLTGSGASAALGNATNIYGELNIGNSTLVTNNLLTMKSLVSGTSWLAPVTGTGSISGDVTVERYLGYHSHRAWRMLSVPTSGTQTIKAAWQEGQAPLANGVPGYGTLLTSISGANGYDAATAGNSFLTLNSGNPGNYVAVPSTNASIATTSGYMVFIRGDRGATVNAGNLPQNQTTLRTKGPLYVGTQPVINVAANNNRMIGNVYASAIDFALLNRSGISAFKVWDPKIAGTSNVGAFVTFSSVNGYQPIPEGDSTSYGSTPNSRIESGQAFVVSGGTLGGSIQLVETAKTTGSKNVLRTNNTIQQLKTTLFAETSTGRQVADGNAVVFDDSYNSDGPADEADVVKSLNFAENFGLFGSNGSNLVIEGRKQIANTDTIRFNMTNIKPQQVYTLEFKPENISSNLVAYLEDTYDGSRIPVSLSARTSFNFTTNTNAASSLSSRFRIVFKTNTSVPVTLVSLKAFQKGSSAQIDWKVINEKDTKTYEVEYSTDALHFAKIGSLTALANGSPELNYMLVHETPSIGDNYYRVKSIGSTGNVTFTEKVKLLIGKGNNGFNIYPNPVVNSRVNVEFINQESGNYTVRLIGKEGRVLYNTLLNHPGGTITQTLRLSSALSAGSYQLEIFAGKELRTIQNIVISNK